MFLAVRQVESIVKFLDEYIAKNSPLVLGLFQVV